MRAGEGAIGQAAAGQVGIDVQSNQVVAAVPKGRTGCHGDAGGNRSWYSAIATVKSGFQPSLNVEIRP